MLRNTHFGQPSNNAITSHPLGGRRPNTNPKGLDALRMVGDDPEVIQATVNNKFGVFVGDLSIDGK